MRVLLCLLVCLWSLVSVANDAIRERMEAVHQGFTISALGEPLLALNALPEFYSHREYALAWNRDEDREVLLDTIREAGRHGLKPSDYHYNVLATFAARSPEDLVPEARADLDLLLSDSLLLLTSHLLHGKVNKDSMEAEWTASRQAENVAKIVTQALEHQQIHTLIDRLTPSSSDYRQLLTAREFLQSLLAIPWEPIAGGPTIRPGMTDDRLPLIRQRLIALGDLMPTISLEEQIIESHYSDRLEAAVTRFQARHGLATDGLIGRRTLASLNITPREKLVQLDANLERWRWLPEDLGDTYIIVNIAGFELRMVKEGKEVLKTRVIVGRPYRQTPVFSDRIRYLVFNPTWTVPRSIMIEDQLPTIRRDPDYLQTMDFTVYRGWGADRERVDPETIDWWLLSKNNFPFQLVQEPGPRNALGRVKFMFPNKFDIYLHDTPARSLFSHSKRTFSSGCIRVEEPFRLASLLLEGQDGWSRERIERVVNSRELTTVYLKEPVPVHLEYWTTWVDGDGTLHFRNDIYERNPRLIARLTESPRTLTPDQARSD
ncbi:L,D-transpeptidase family protein [Marinobacter sp. NP-4(2019)]|uniref:L,D-transpeptidase family protein n=1 Tax=Marinobacter sp. NP-4(2019) TaxID=2488665 RepID=UPI001D190AE4|nr:L,D-transpeptidase family protein [Marinobacter sp. NP-4(2019)]